MTKDQQILDPKSDWNQAPGDEPVFVVRANNWRAAMYLALIVEGKAARKMAFDAALELKRYHEENNIPF